ncbi:MAG: hypothetical protein OXE50_02805 [Chloroflexi bacterium]|nr:hypothetical protein [Chloroflexota bacterium]
MCVFIENTDVTLELDMKIASAGLTPRSRVHIHRCKSVEVTVNYNQDQKKGSSLHRRRFIDSCSP